jgi:hypothetical protein
MRTYLPVIACHDGFISLVSLLDHRLIPPAKPGVMIG